MNQQSRRYAVTATFFLLGTLGMGPAYGDSRSNDLSTGVASGVLSVAVVPVAVVVSVPAVITAGVVTGATLGLVNAGEIITQEIEQQNFGRPLPISDETLMVGPSPAAAIRGAER